MFKQPIIRLALGLTLLASLLSGGVALSAGATAAKAAPVGPRLACVQIILPPCV
jgi:hypothetical protein